jgi:hypothetical protein
VNRIIIVVITVATVLFITVGTLWPNVSSFTSAGIGPQLLHTSSSPQAAVESLLAEIGRKDWGAAYSSLANRAEFTESDFVRDLSGSYPSLRTYATLDGIEVHALHASADEAQIRASLRWSTVVGTFQDVRELRVIRAGDQWKVAWPLVKEPRVPPQVIAVNYLRWDVIYRGPEDDWGVQDVEAPHVRIVDMHPVDRGAGVIILGEILNEDVVPAYVTVKATLLAKDGTSIATEDAFDKISHVLLPKQVSPFRIDFRNVRLARVDSIRMNPSSSLIAASADPVIEIEDQKLSGLPQPTLTGELLNQSGQVVNVTHVLGTFYDRTGQLVWVADDYANRALMPQTPVQFAVSLPADLADRVNSYRVVTSPYSWNRLQ